MKKLLACDLDGTLVFNGSIKQEDLKSINNLKQHNCLFGISTGRPYNGVKFLKQEYGIDADFYVLLNGALVLNKEGEVLKHDIIPYDVLEKICVKYKECNLMGVDCGFETVILVGEESSLWENITYGDVCSIKGKKHSLISIDFSNKSIHEINKICDDINGEFGEYVIAYRNSCFIDVVPKGCSKGEGVKLIIKDLGIDISCVYVIGDSFNDVSMFNETKNSFTFNNVEEELKKYANFNVDSVSECIENYILGE